MYIIYSSEVVGGGLMTRYEAYVIPAARVRNKINIRTGNIWNVFIYQPCDYVCGYLFTNRFRIVQFYAYYLSL